MNSKVTINEILERLHIKWEEASPYALALIDNKLKLFNLNEINKMLDKLESMQHTASWDDLRHNVMGKFTNSSTRIAINTHFDFTRYTPSEQIQKKQITKRER